MDVASITTALSEFIAAHRSNFDSLSARETALLELGALTMASEHYRLIGYDVTIQNPKNGLFAAKLTSRGHPFNFSWFRCESKGGDVVEIHCNLAVEGARGDGAIYVVDVAVAKPDAVPKTKPAKPWKYLPKDALVTFVEVKKLVVYPMLLAQFIGIVHEIKPKNLKPSNQKVWETQHFYPALISLGYLKGTSKEIIKGFAKRKYQVCVVHNFDVHLSAMRRGAASDTPFKSIAQLT